MGERVHVDVETLASLREIMEDEFQILIDTFSRDSLLRIDSIKDAVAQKNADLLRRSAHSFKGSCSNIGAAHLAALCDHMEKQGVLQEFNGLEQVVLEMEQEYNAVDRALSQL